MTESKPSFVESGRATLPIMLALPIALLLIVLFVAILFPWDAVARRLSFEIASATGSQITIGQLRPSLSARGPVLAAQDVVIEHPAVERVRIDLLEIAPRFSTSWFGAVPTLRIWADSELALVDGVLTLGDLPAYVGRVTRIEIEKLPLRLEASGLGIFGRLDANADIVLDPGGFMTGRVDFESPELLIQSSQLPIAIPFTRAAGVIEILASGATRIESLALEGNVLEGTLSGEIEMAHRSQSPPINLQAQVRIVQPDMRGMASAAGIDLSSSGEADLQLSGTLDAPEFYTIPGGRRS